MTVEATTPATVLFIAFVCASCRCAIPLQFQVQFQFQSQFLVSASSTQPDILCGLHVMACRVVLSRLLICKISAIRFFN